MSLYIIVYYCILLYTMLHYCMSLSFCVFLYYCICLYIFENYCIYCCALLYFFVYYCILLSIIEYYCQLLKIVVSYSCFTCILLHILVYYEKCCVFVYYYIMQKSARIMGLEGFMCFEASLPGLRKQQGGWGGRSPPPFANTTLASLVWKGYSYAGFKKQRGV